MGKAKTKSELRSVRIEGKEIISESKNCPNGIDRAEPAGVVASCCRRFTNLSTSYLIQFQRQRTEVSSRDGRRTADWAWSSQHPGWWAAAYTRKTCRVLAAKCERCSPGIATGRRSRRQRSASRTPERSCWASASCGNLDANRYVKYVINR